MVRPMLPTPPVAPREPIGPGKQGLRTAGQLGGAGGIMAVLYWLGLDGELAVFLGWLYAVVVGGFARWARDRNHATKPEERNPLLVILERLAPIVLIAWLCTGCAVAGKLGPGPYGWAMLQYSIADTANVRVEALGGEIELGEPGKHASAPDGETGADGVP